MALTSNSYTGNGLTVLYDFTFPYLDTTDIKVSLNGVNTTSFTFDGAYQIRFNTAPANGVAIKIYRATNDSLAAAQFYPGSAIRSTDLNKNFTQNLYVTQEANNASASAVTTAAGAVTTANTASSNAAAAVSTANTASSNASAAVSTANTASTNASNAVTTANSAVSTANTATTTANSAVSTANAATATAASAVSTANTASSNASAAVSTANTASTTAASAVSTANTASTTAGNAVTTSNSAVSTANGAVTTANNAVTTANSAQTAANNAVVTSSLADTKANQAIAAVAASINYTLVANVAAIPASPANGTYIEVADSTGIQSFTPLVGLPGGFVGDAGLTVRLVYQTSNSSWNWLTYFANNSETRYLKLAGGTLTGALTLSGAPSSGLQATTKTYVDTADATLTTAASAAQTTANTGVTNAAAAQSTANTAVTNAAAAQTTANAAVVRAGDTMTGALGVTAGTASAPSLYFTGDTNTGLFSAGADQVAIATGGSGRLFIDASGNVGVGVSPTNASGYSTLDINNATNGGRLRFLVNGTAYGQIYNNAATDFRCGTVANVPFHLISNASIALTVDTSQRVGIGTFSPNSVLQVNSGTNLGGVLIGFNAGSSNFYDADLQIFRTGNGTERVRIDSSGNLGLGVAPNTWGTNRRAIQIGGNSSSALSLGAAVSEIFYNGYFNTSNQLIATTTGQVGYHDFNNNVAGGFTWGTSNASVTAGNVATVTTRMTLLAGGNVGIGDTAPGSRLSVYGSTGGIFKFQGDTTGNGYGYFLNSSGTSIGYLGNGGGGALGGGTANDFVVRGEANLLLAIGNSEKARITADGKFLVGTSTSALEKLVVLGDGGGIQINRNQTGTPTSGQALGSIGFKGIVSANSNAAAEVLIQASADENHSGSTAGSRLEFHTKASGVGPGSSPTERFRITSTGAQFSVIPGGSTIYPQFACRAWVNFDGTGTAVGGNPPIRASGNVSSITDNGTGHYTVTFSTAMPDANYAIVGTSSTDSGNIGVFSSVAGTTDFSKATNTVTVRTISTSTSVGRDYNSVNIAIFR